MGAQSPRAAAEELNAIVHKDRQFEAVFHSHASSSEVERNMKLFKPAGAPKPEMQLDTSLVQQTDYGIGAGIN